jgi:hypothetical protein
MAQQALPPSSTFPLFAVSLLLAAAFVASYGQAPLYYSNQNQYFLHGLAQAGEGLLREDWLAKSLDPTPVFSTLVAGTDRFLHPWVFCFYLALLQGAYAAALLGLFVQIAGRDVAARRWPVFAVLLVLIHSAAIRWGSYRLLGHDYPWFFQAGVAGQYILGGMLQPSVFGVLLVVAISFFVQGRPLLAALCLAAGATLHPTYLLPGGMLTLGFATVLLRERRLRLALGTMTLALVLVVPVIAHALLTFAPTSTAQFAEAQGILVNLRIPHHSLPRLWLDPVAAGQIAWMVLGVAFAWGTRLFFVLAIPLLLGTLLTLLQVATGSNTLALLFPWRISAILVPLATTVLLSRLVALPVLPLERRVIRQTALIGILVLVASGLFITFGRLGFHVADEELAVMEYVRQAKQPGDVYLLPVRMPKLAATTRGSLSSDFKRLPDKRQDTRVIPVDLQRFRLTTGAPIYVDFKSIPYKDVEVIEWRDRMEWAQSVQEQVQQGHLLQALAQLRQRGVTHLVEPTSQGLPESGLRLLYEDAYYRVYQLTGRPGEDR